MPIDLRFNQYGDYLHAIVKGWSQLEDWIESLEQLFAICRAGEALKILVDVRELVSSSNVAPKIDFMYHFKEQYGVYLQSGATPLKIASVWSPGHLGSCRSGEESANTHGLPLTVFTSINDAMQWLGIETTDRDPSSSS